MVDHPIVRQTVLDAVDARGIAEFYRRLLGLRYRPGDEPPDDDGPDRPAQEWIALRDDRGTPVLAVQPVDTLSPVDWPHGHQRVHLDLTVPTTDDLHRQQERALDLGASLLLDRSDDEEEPLFVDADPAGHPFCIFVAPGTPDDGR